MFINTLVAQSKSKSYPSLTTENFNLFFLATEKLLVTHACQSAAPKKTTTSSWSAGATAGLLQHTSPRTNRWNQKPSQDSSWLDGHALSFVLEGLVHERRQVSLAVAREDHLRGTTNKSDLQRWAWQNGEHMPLMTPASYDDELAPVLGPPGDPDGGDGRRARRDPDLNDGDRGRQFRRCRVWDRT